MTTPFDPERCPIPPITRIPATPLLPDTTVPEPPGEIVDCLDPLTPLAVEPVCPTIEAGTATLNLGVPASEIGLAFTVGKSNCCEFTLGVELNLPNIVGGACPEMIDLGPRTVAYTDGGITPDGTIHVSVTPGPDCTFDFDIDLEVHCPELTVAAVERPILYTSASAGQSQLTITRGDGCDYEFDLNIVVPCPPVQVSSLPVTFVSESAGQLTLNATVGDNCEIDLEFDLALACTTLTAAPLPKIVEPLTYTSESIGTVRWEIVPGPNCSFEFAGVPVLTSPGALGVLEDTGASPRITTTMGFGFASLLRINRFTGVLTAVKNHVKVYNPLLVSEPGNTLVRLQLTDGGLVIADVAEPVCYTSLDGRIIGALGPVAATLQITGHVTGKNYGTFAVPSGVYSIPLALMSADTSVDLVATASGLRFTANAPVNVTVTACVPRAVPDIVATPAAGYAYYSNGSYPCNLPTRLTVAYTSSLYGSGTITSGVAVCIPYMTRAVGSCASVSTVLRLVYVSGPSYTLQYPEVAFCPTIDACPGSIFTYQNANSLIGGTGTAVVICPTDPNSPVGWSWKITYNSPSGDVIYPPGIHTIEFYED